MFYKKNLPTWERIVRFLGSLAMVSCAAHFWGTPLGYIWAVGAVVLVGTSLVGYCPMCAAAGRKGLE